MIWVAILIGVFLLFVFPKQMGALIGLIVVGAFVTYLYFEAEENNRKKQRDAVTITIKYDTKSCSKEYPLFVIIKNSSKKVVEKVSWNIGAHKSGYSNNLIDYGYSSEYGTPYSSDKILNRRQRFSTCYKVPSLKGSHASKELVWSATRKSIEFKRD